MSDYLPFTDRFGNVWTKGAVGAKMDEGEGVSAAERARELAAKAGEALGYYFVPGEHHDRPYLEGLAALDALVVVVERAEQAEKQRDEERERFHRHVETMIEPEILRRAEAAEARAEAAEADLAAARAERAAHETDIKLWERSRQEEARRADDAESALAAAEARMREAERFAGELERQNENLADALAMEATDREVEHYDRAVAAESALEAAEAERDDALRVVTPVDGRAILGVRHYLAATERAEAAEARAAQLEDALRGLRNTLENIADPYNRDNRRVAWANEAIDRIDAVLAAAGGDPA